MSFGRAPSSPAPPPPQPQRSDADIQAQRAKEAASIARRRGRSSQILAGERQMLSTTTDTSGGSATLGA